MKPGVVVLPNNPAVQHPVITDPALAAAVKVSGFDINGLRVSYSAADDTLSVGIEQPLSQKPGHPGPVVAGDADNNGNDGPPVDPAVVALEGAGFKDFQDFGGSEFMGAFLDLKGQSVADVAAGYAINDPRSPKQYQVAEAVVKGKPGSTPLDFGTAQVQQPGTVYNEVPAFEGNVYKVNSPAHPNLEFSIAHFSQLYLRETGQPLTPTSTIGVGAVAGSGDDPGIGEAFFPEQKFTLAQATVTPTTCPPVSPPVIINPHQNQHINTAHPTLVRANVLGSSGFDVTRIDPSTVTLGGAHPVFSFDHFINKDNWPDATFVFKGTDVQLPSGHTDATLAGKLTDGTSFSSSVRVFNRDSSFYSPAAVASAQARQESRAAAGVVVAPNSPVAISGTSIALKKKAFAPGSTNAQLVNLTLKVDDPGATSSPAAAEGPITAASLRRGPQAPHRHTVKIHSDRIGQAERAQINDAVAIDSKPEPAGKVVALKRPHGKSQAKVPAHIDQSLDRFVRQVGAVNVATGQSLGTQDSNPAYVR
ncbi:MAG: hypothetical protein LC745_02035, partial [Planctomycetia bacterium]|nr:hypothetical protein [Planctomycetia bacterium]